MSKKDILVVILLSIITKFIYKPMFKTATEIQVNDSILAQKKKICYKDVLAVVTETLRERKFYIQNVSLVWLRFSQEVEPFVHCRSPRTDGFHAGYFLDLRPYEGNVIFGFYQPFSGKVYIIESKCLCDAEAVVGNLQFPLAFRKTQTRRTSNEYFDVKRLSRCFKVGRKCFSFNYVLTACEDREVVKTVVSTPSSLAEDAFYEEEILTEIQRNSPMFFNKFYQI